MGLVGLGGRPAVTSAFAVCKDDALQARRYHRNGALHTLCLGNTKPRPLCDARCLSMPLPPRAARAPPRVSPPPPGPSVPARAPPPSPSPAAPPHGREQAGIRPRKHRAGGAAARGPARVG